MDSFGECFVIGGKHRTWIENHHTLCLCITIVQILNVQLIFFFFLPDIDLDFVKHFKQAIYFSQTTIQALTFIDVTQLYTLYPLYPRYPLYPTLSTELKFPESQVVEIILHLKLNCGEVMCRLYGSFYCTTQMIWYLFFW